MPLSLRSGTFEGAENISGERLVSDYLGRRVACAHCPTACVHLVALRIPYPNDPYFYKTKMLGYDHELVYAARLMLGIDDVSGMLLVIDEAEIQGLDVMSAGVVLAWATEALEVGLVTLEDTDGLALKWGEADVYIQALERLVTQPTDFYKTLARGAEYAASIYGGSDFALTFGGNEMPGYHTGPGAHLGYLSGARHSHLDSSGYSLDQKTLTTDQPLTPKETATALLKEEGWRQVFSSLVICFFARGVYTPEIIQKALGTVGLEYSLEELDPLGARILKMKHQFKEREGFDLEEVRIPKRILETPSSLGLIDEEFMLKTLAEIAGRVE